MEQRRACRYKCNVPCTIGYMDETKMVCHSARVLDISMTGMQIWCEAKRPAGTVVMVKVPDYDPLYGQVMRCGVGTTHGFSLGVKFVDGTLPITLFSRLAFPEAPACFKRLGLSLPCTPDDVKRAYRRLVKTAHPDYGGTDEQFKALRNDYMEALGIVTEP
jgi:hypothetical protein